MKKYIFIASLSALSYALFAEAKKEIENIIKKDVNSKEFQQADKKIHTLQEQGDKLSSQGKYQKALECFQKALKQADKLYGKNSTAAALVYTAIGKMYLKEGKKLKAADNLLTAGEIFKKSAGGIFRPHAGRLLFIQAGFLYYESDSYRKAWQTLIKAKKDISKFSTQEKKRYMAKFYRYLALALFKDKKYDKANVFFNEMLRRQNLSSELSPEELGFIYYFLGRIALKKQELKKAIDFFEKAAVLYKQSINDEIKVGLYFFMSAAYCHNKDTNKALKYSKEGITLARNIYGEKSGWTACHLVNHAMILYKMKQTEKAIEVLRKAHKTFILSNEKIAAKRIAKLLKKWNTSFR